MRVISFPQQVGWLGGKVVDFHPWVTPPNSSKDLNVNLRMK